MSWIFYYFVSVRKAVCHTQVRQTQDVLQLYGTMYEHRPEEQKYNTQFCLCYNTLIPLLSDNFYEH